MLASPEVNTTAEDRPRLRARIPSVRVGETGVGSPHDLLELPEFAKEAGVSVIDFLNITLQLGMRVALNIPQTVGQSASTSASHFLLLRSPIRKLDFVREQDTASHDMDKTELAFNGSETLLGDRTSSLLLNNLDSEKIVGITLKSFVTIGGNFVLPVSLSDRGADVMRMQAAVGWAVVKTNNGTVLDVNRLRKGIPGLGTVDGLAVNSKGLGLVFKKPDIVVILVRVQCNLLLLAASRVHKRVRVQIATLGIDMADSDTAAHHDVGGNVLHSLVVEGGLELGAHKAVTISRVLEADKMDGEHGHVESHGDDDKAEYPSHEVLGEQTLYVCELELNRHSRKGAYHGHILVVAQKNPELDESEGANPSNGKESNPLDAHGDTQTETCKDKPKPPAQLESFGRTKLVLIGKARKGKDSESGCSNKRRIKENEASLCEKTVFCI